MDIKKKFILQVGVLLLVIVLFSLSIVYLSLPSSEPEEDNTTEFIPIDVEALNAIDDNLDGGADDPLSQGEVFGVLHIDENIPPSRAVHQSQGDLLARNEQRYRVLLSISWSNQLHRDWYPVGAHISPVVIWSHTLENNVFQVERVASEGLELLAETGQTDLFVEELEELKRYHGIHAYSVGEVFDAPGYDEVELILSSQSSKASMVSMIAPSPDWILAVSNIDLVEDGAWVDYRKVSVELYDAGTDSGDEFTSPDNDTFPKGIILPLEDTPILPIAVVEFIRI